MYTLPPLKNPLVPEVSYPGLMPIRFGIRPYIELCQSFDAALAELEARFPSKLPALSLSARNQRLHRRPK